MAYKTVLLQTITEVEGEGLNSLSPLTSNTLSTRGVDELRPGTEVSVAVAAEGSGTLILDVGVLEVSTS
jgi:hypothetical protein